VSYRTFWTSKSTPLFFGHTCRSDYWYGHGRTGRTGDDGLVSGDGRRRIAADYLRHASCALKLWFDYFNLA